MRELSDRTLYRRFVQAADLVSFKVTIKETDLLILADRDLTDETRELVLTHRFQLEEHIARQPEFMTPLSPLAESAAATRIVRLMGEAGRWAVVGPRAAVHLGAGGGGIAGIFTRTAHRERGGPLPRRAEGAGGGDFHRRERTRNPTRSPRRNRGTSPGNMHLVGPSGAQSQFR